MSFYEEEKKYVAGKIQVVNPYIIPAYYLLQQQKLPWTKSVSVDHRTQRRGTSKQTVLLLNKKNNFKCILNVKQENGNV